MAAGPDPEHVDGDRRDLVFLSYSHDDAEWAQALTGFLKPLTRTQRMRVWVDVANIRAGDLWHPEIGRAIAQARIAVLLVSARFLASDYIMNTELPALLTHRVRLAPVLVGDCLWPHVPQLAQRQWLHDPGRDGALSLVADQIGERDRRLVQICTRLLGLLPDPLTASPDPQPTTELPEPPERSRMAAVPRGLLHGQLYGVPDPPPGYVARDELAALIAAVTSTTGSGAVGVTGTVTGTATAVGVHGQGGIGKTVLAAALARDTDIRARFPDGVHWITVGERADILGVQLGLLTRLGVTGPMPRTPHEAHARLTDILADRRVLLVVDDIWSDAAAAAFHVTGPHGRTLYTTRDPQILTTVRARPHRVDVLSPAAARALAAAVLDLDPDQIPVAAQAAFAEVGQIALAVALLAATVRGGGSWDHVAAALRRDTDIYGDHPYANTFKAMQIAVTHLPPDLTPALLSLAVFPPTPRSRSRRSPDTGTTPAPGPPPRPPRTSPHSPRRTCSTSTTPPTTTTTTTTPPAATTTTTTTSMTTTTTRTSPVRAPSGSTICSTNTCCCTPGNRRCCTPPCSTPTAV